MSQSPRNDGATMGRSVDLDVPRRDDPSQSPRRMGDAIRPSSQPFGSAPRTIALICISMNAFETAVDPKRPVGIA
jgi:hypothetical protein